MGAKLNLAGKHFNYWRVNREAGRGKLGGVLWECTCTLCNKEYVVSGATLKNGKSRMCRSCSAKQKSERLDAAHRAVRTHGLSQTRLYTVLDLMHRRCEDKNNKSYQSYGGRGIKVCEEWAMDRVADFVKWAKENGYKEGLQIDRIDVNGNYEPSNCRFVTHKENARNTRKNRFVVVFGEKMTLAEAVERYGQVTYKATHLRISRGMAIEDALFTPNRRMRATN